MDWAMAVTAHIGRLPPPRPAPGRRHPRLLRCIRLAELTISTDPKLVSAAFGIHPRAATHYLADYVDDGRLHVTGLEGPGGH
jgi:hypothetical protein